MVGLKWRRRKTSDNEGLIQRPKKRGNQFFFLKIVYEFTTPGMPVILGWREGPVEWAESDWFCVDISGNFQTRDKSKTEKIKTLKTTQKTHTHTHTLPLENTFLF